MGTRKFCLETCRYKREHSFDLAVMEFTEEEDPTRRRRRYGGKEEFWGQYWVSSGLGTVAWVGSHGHWGVNKAGQSNRS